MPDTLDPREKQPKTPAASRQPAPHLRVRPVKGKTDHAALSREFMARFPKIRAALAK